MKRILIAGALALAAGGQALAADLPQPGPPPPRAPATYVPAPVPVMNWTGFYIGANGGYAFGQSSWSDPVAGNTGNFNTSGFLAGGTVGANYQWGQFVLGLEGDFDWANINGTTFSTAGGCGFVGCETKADWFATARGRAGYAFDRVLLYGTGGAAFTNVQAAAGAFPFSSSSQVGWTAGAGIEYLITPNLTAKVEYLYADFGNVSCSPASCGGTATTVTLNENIVRGGINFKFGGW
jgi:outer membrane immunogenic protein